MLSLQLLMYFFQKILCVKNIEFWESNLEIIITVNLHFARTYACMSTCQIKLISKSSNKKQKQTLSSNNNNVLFHQSANHKMLKSFHFEDLTIEFKIN